MKLISCFFITILILTGCTNKGTKSQQIRGLEKSEVRQINTPDIRNEIGQ